MRIIYDYYLNKAKMEHFFVNKKNKKIIKIPFHIILTSSNGYYSVKLGKYKIKNIIPYSECKNHEHDAIFETHIDKEIPGNSEIQEIPGNSEIFEIGICEKKENTLENQTDEETKRKNTEEFFSMMCNFFIVTEGIDCITEKIQEIPIFMSLYLHRPKNGIYNLNIFSTIIMFQNMLNINVLNSFLVFNQYEYDYYQNDIY
jgi:hypothetical protein